LKCDHCCFFYFIYLWIPKNFINTWHFLHLLIETYRGLPSGSPAGLQTVINIRQINWRSANSNTFPCWEGGSTGNSKIHKNKKRNVQIHSGRVNISKCRRTCGSAVLFWPAQCNICIGVNKQILFASRSFVGVRFNGTWNLDSVFVFLFSVFCFGLYVSARGCVHCSLCTVTRPAVDLLLLNCCGLLYSISLHASKAKAKRQRERDGRRELAIHWKNCNWSYYIYQLPTLMVLWLSRKILYC